MMKVTKTPISDLLIIQPKIFEDNRGYFMETFRQDVIEEYLDIQFIQDNESQSNKNVLRGLHFQSTPHAQDKLVRVIKGAVLDVAVDLRPNSPTFKQYFSITLSESNKTQFFIPKGFAHGFVTLEDKTIFSYKCSNYYHPDSEHSLLWNDKDLNIDWNVSTPIISQKDQAGKPLKKILSIL